MWSSRDHKCCLAHRFGLRHSCLLFFFFICIVEKTQNFMDNVHPFLLVVYGLTVRSCPSVIMANVILYMASNKPAGLLHPISLPSQIWSEASMGFIKGLPKSEEANVILVVIDHLRNYTHFMRLRQFRFFLDHDWTFKHGNFHKAGIVLMFSTLSSTK